MFLFSEIKKNSTAANTEATKIVQLFLRTLKFLRYIMLFKIPIKPNKDKCDYFNVIIVSSLHFTVTLIEKHPS